MSAESYRPLGEYSGHFPIQRVPGSNWLVIGEVWENDLYARQQGRWPSLLFVDAHYDGDDPRVDFLDPADFPRLPKRVVQDAQAQYRKDVRLRAARMTHYEISYWQSLDEREQVANLRIAIHRQRPWERGGIVIAQGGFILKDGDLPPPSGHTNADWGRDLIADYIAFKKARDFERADALRREMTIAGPLQIFEHKDGVEFIVTGQRASDVLP